MNKNYNIVTRIKKISTSQVVLVWVLIFILLINTSNFWKRYTGSWGIELAFFLFLCWLGLVPLFFGQIGMFSYKLFKDKHFGRLNLLNSLLIMIMVPLTYFKPSRIIDYNKFEAPDRIKAYYNGSGIYGAILQLKSDSTFVANIGSFETTRYYGKFHIKNDTIWLDYDWTFDFPTEHSFVVLYKDSLNSKIKNGFLYYYTTMKDTFGYPMRFENH